MKLRYLPGAFCRAAAIACILFSCGSATYDVRITNADINARLAAKFPITKKLLRVFEVSFSNPAVVLHDDTDKITFSIDVEAKGLSLDQRTPLQGSITATNGIRFNNKNGSFYLTDVVIDKVSVPGLADPQQQGLREMLSAALHDYLCRVPVYTLKRGIIKTAAEKLVLKDVRITDGALVIALGL
jgi:hypothetical protein